MKRILILLSIAFIATSCFDVSPNTYTGQLIAHFEYSDLKFDKDSVLFENVGGECIYFSEFAFHHTLSPDNIWFDGGFLLSGLDMTTDEDALAELGDKLTYRACVLPPTKNNRYLVHYTNPDDNLMPEHDMEFLSKKNGTCTMIGCYVTNTVEVAEAVKNTFGKGDKLELKATGWFGSQKTGEAKVTLAEFSTQKDSIVSTWTPFDLAKLGTVEYVDFEIIAPEGREIPGYFCMDQMMATVKLEY